MAKPQQDIALDPGFWTTTSWIQLLYGIWVNMAQLGIGLAFGFAAVQVPQLSSPESEIQITRDEASWIASVLTLFSPIGCIISGFLMDKLGRKIMLVICQCPMCIGWLYTGLAGTSKQIIIGRAITGIGCGMAMGPPRIFATEISLPNMRGVIGAFPALAMSMGISMQAGLGYFFAWEFLCFACAAFTFCNLLVFNLLPETPYFILIKGTAESARKNLAKFRGKKYDIDSEMTQLIEFKVDNKIRKLNMMEEVHVLFSPSACKPFSLINAYILVSQASGISVILIWAIEILKTANSSFDVHTGNFLMALTRLFVGTITSILLFRVGRKPLALSSAIGVSVVCFTLGFFIHYNDEPSIVPQVGFMAYMAFASLGYYTLPFLMMSELYPLQVRGTLGGITVSLTSFLVFSTTKMFPYIRDSLGLANTIILFGICSLFGSLFLYYFLPETKELTLQEIEEYYNARRPTLVSQRRLMTLQMQQQLHSDRSLGPAKSKSDSRKSSDNKLKNSKTEKITALDMFKRDVTKPQNASLKETIKRAEVMKQKQNTSNNKTTDSAVSPKSAINSEAIKNKEEAVNNKENVNTEKKVQVFKRRHTSLSSIESLHKNMEQGGSFKSKEYIHAKLEPKNKFKDFNKGPAEKKLIIHSDESLSYYTKRTKIEPSPKKNQGPRIEQGPMKETSPEKEQEPKPESNTMNKQKPDTKTEPKKEKGPQQEKSPKMVKISEHNTELSSVESIDKSVKQNSLYKSKENLIAKEDNTKNKEKRKDTEKKVTIDSEGSLSDSEASITSEQKSKAKEAKNKENNYFKNEGQDDDDINKPSTSKSIR